MLRKNLSILWTPTDMGLIIQNLKTNTFFELNEMQECIWSYIDGTHSEKDIVSRIAIKYSNISIEGIEREVHSLITELGQHDLIIADHNA